jgi:signal transduction histidine kinase
MRIRSPHWQLLPWIALTTLIAFIVVAMLSRFVELRTLTRDIARVNVANELDRQVEQWSDAHFSNLSRWSQYLVTSPAKPSEETAQQLLKTVEAIFRWEREPDGSVTLLDLVGPVLEKQEIVATCLTDARNYSFNRTANPPKQVSLYLEGCARETPAVQLEAIASATKLYINSGQPLEAIALLQQQLPVDIGSTSLRLLELQHLRASLMVRNDVDGGLQHLLTIAEAIAEEPTAGALTNKIRTPTLAILRDAGWLEQAQNLDIKLGKHQRLRRAHRALPGLLSTPPPTGASCATPKCTVPLFLFEANGVGVALAMDREKIGQDLLNRLSQYKESAALVDANGVVIFGNRDTSPITVKQPLRPTLSKLSIGIRDSALESQTKHLDDQLTILLVLGLSCLLLALLGISAQYRANKRLHRLLARQSEFTRRSAHELRTPLAVVSLLAENLADGLYNDKSTAEVAGQIIDETNRLATRVDELLLLSRPTNNSTKSQFEPEEAILDTLVQWAPRYKSANIQLSVDIAPTGLVYGDQLALRDAIGALLDNAYKYINPSQKKPGVWLSLTQVGSEAVLEIADNGLGVPKEMRVDIFEQFVRIEGDHRGTSGGYGLGLSQVKRTVSAHNGTVTCSEGTDGGARFTLTLPISTETNKEE